MPTEIVNTPSGIATVATEIVNTPIQIAKVPTEIANAPSGIATVAIEIVNAPSGIATVATPAADVPTEIAETCIEIAGTPTALAEAHTLVQIAEESLALCPTRDPAPEIADFIGDDWRRRPDSNRCIRVLQAGHYKTLAMNHNT